MDDGQQKCEIVFNVYLDFGNQFLYFNHVN